MSLILVIEDETMLREEVMDWLTFEGYEAIGAEDGVVGVEIASHQPPDLIICDITMPRLDGYGVLLEIHANPATTNIPFIFVTARAAHEDIRKGMSSGANDYITKPFTRLELLHAVQSRLEKKVSLERDFQHEVEQLQWALTHEREQRLLKAKLMAMFSHDFRNPLASIMSSNSLLRDYSDRIDEKRRKMHMNQIESSVRLLLQMLDDMLMIAQMETGNLQFKPEPLAIEQFLQSIIDEFQIIHGNTHTLFFESNFHSSVMADSRLLRQIASNLLSNAIKYSPKEKEAPKEDHKEVHIMLNRQNGHCILSVQDRGIGIPEAEQARLFDAFQRASNVGTASGTGLGLAIVKQVVDLHGGSISLESHEGAGTTVTVKIPYVAPKTDDVKILPL